MSGITTYAVGETIDLHLLIKQMTKGTTNTGKPFLTIILQDKSGDIEAKLWDASDQDEKAYQPETIVKVVRTDLHTRTGSRMDTKICITRWGHPFW